MGLLPTGTRRVIRPCLSSCSSIGLVSEDQSCGGRSAAFDTSTLVDLIHIGLLVSAQKELWKSHVGIGLHLTLSPDLLYIPIVEKGEHLISDELVSQLAPEP